MAIKSHKLSNKLLKLAKSKNFGNKQFAEFVGISENASTAYLKKGRVPETAQLIKIAAKFKISIDWLLDDLLGDQSKSNDCVILNRACEPEPSYKIGDDLLLKMTKEILESQTDYAQSLATNIKSFHNALNTETRLSGLEEEIKNQREEFKMEIDLLKKANLKKEKSIKRIVGCSRHGRQEDDHGDVETGNG